MTLFLFSPLGGALDLSEDNVELICQDQMTQ